MTRQLDWMIQLLRPMAPTAPAPALAPVPAPAPALNIPGARPIPSPKTSPPVVSPTCSQSIPLSPPPIPATSAPLDLVSKFPVHESLAREPAPVTVAPPVHSVVAPLLSCSSDLSTAAPPVRPARESLVIDAFSPRRSSHPCFVSSLSDYASIALLPLWLKNQFRRHIPWVDFKYSYKAYYFA
jgi:hypothetical protein